MTWHCSGNYFYLCPVFVPRHKNRAASQPNFIINECINHAVAVKKCAERHDLTGNIEQNTTIQ